MNGLFHLAKTDCPLVSASAAALANALHIIPFDGQSRFGAAASRKVPRVLLKGPLELPGRTLVSPFPAPCPHHVAHAAPTEIVEPPGRDFRSEPAGFMRTIRHRPALMHAAAHALRKSPTASVDHPQATV